MNEEIYEGVVDYDRINWKDVYAVVSFDKQTCTVFDALLLSVHQSKAVKVTVNPGVGISVELLDVKVPADFFDRQRRLPMTQKEKSRAKLLDDLVNGVGPAMVERTFVDPEIEAIRDRSEHEWQESVDKHCQGGLLPSRRPWGDHPRRGGPADQLLALGD